LQTNNAPDQQPGAGFGAALAPLGDLNADGFQDYAVGAGLYDGTGATPRVDQGRIYILRSDNSPAPAGPTPPSNVGPVGPQGVPGTGAPGAAGPSAPAAKAIVLAGRALDLAASRSRVRAGTRVRLRGSLDAFANPSSCQSRQTVTIQRRSTTGGTFRTIDTARTTTSGAFSSSTRVTQSAAYRARVPQTSTCLGTASTAERVIALRSRRPSVSRT